VARKYLNSILSAAPVALVTLDSTGVCTGMEGHGLQTLGIHSDEVIGRSVFELTGRLPELEDCIRQALRGIAGKAYTSLGSHAAEVWAQPKLEIDGSVTGVTLVGYDVSEKVRSRRARAEIRELQTTNRERSTFVTTVTHELKNPLTSIITFNEILSANEPENLTPQQAHALSVIQKSSERLDALINDLLDLTSNFNLQLTNVDVASFISEIVDSQEPVIAAAGQRLVHTLPEVPFTVRADQLRLTQVITNLISNASKYSPKGSEVTLEAALVGNNAVITVEDDGPGIPASEVDKIFDPFYRVNNSVPGTGLGLAIAQKIAELHNGRISLESTLGVGTRVSVSIPGARLKQPESHVRPEGGRQRRRRSKSLT
jgi:signal transduction histidine kinase